MPNRVHDGSVGHAKVENEHMRTVRAQQSPGRLHVRRRGDHLEVGFGFEQPFQRAPHERMADRHHDSDARFSARAGGGSTRDGVQVTAHDSTVGVAANDVHRRKVWSASEKYGLTRGVYSAMITPSRR